MPSGKVHATTSAVIALGCATSALFIDPETALQLCAGAATGIMLSPDLDVIEGNISVQILRKVPVIGRVLATFWRVYWIPYAVMIGWLSPGVGVQDGHRSPWSHLPILSTAIRLVYVIWPFWLIYGFVWPPLWFCAGLVASDTLHTLLDGVRWPKHG